MHLLITRPEFQAGSTAEKLLAMGHSATVESLLTIEPTADLMPEGGYDGLIVTSANCLPYLHQTWPVNKRHQTPLLATGSATAEASCKIGFSSAQHVSGSAMDLVAYVPDWMKTVGLNQQSRLLYPCAEEVAHPIDKVLADQNILCQRWPVYRTIPVDRFTNKVKSALHRGEFDGVLLYSPRTAHTFVQLLLQSNITIKDMRIYALSQQIVDILPKSLRNNAKFPSMPQESALLDLIGR